MAHNEHLGRNLSFQLEKTFPHQLGKMSMTELKRDPDQLAILNKMLEELSNEYATSINELKRKVTHKFHKSKVARKMSGTYNLNKPIFKSSESTKCSKNSVPSKSSRPSKLSRPKTKVSKKFKRGIRRILKYSQQNL